MAHSEQKHFVNSVKETFPEYFVGKKVLEVGSLNINGTCRDLFQDCHYIGIDLDHGPCVDIVCKGHLYPEPDNSFDVVFSTECFEHDIHVSETFNNMIRLLKPKGLLFFTCAWIGRPEHGTTRTQPESSPFTNDYYRNLDEPDFHTMVDIKATFERYEFSVNSSSFDLYFYGIKK